LPTLRTRRASWTWLKPFENSLKRTTPENRILRKAEQTPTWLADVILRLVGTPEIVAGFPCIAGRAPQ
jgi:hypothetical protein